MKAANSNSLYFEIKEILEEARQSAYCSVNLASPIGKLENGLSSMNSQESNGQVMEMHY